MSKTLKTSEIAKLVKVHPNTVRLYEEIGFLPPIPREKNGYRKYNEGHVLQLKLIQKCLRVELLQNGLRKHAIAIIKAAAKGEYDNALLLSHTYFNRIEQEQESTKESIQIVKNLLANTEEKKNTKTYLRSEVCKTLEITMDTLRNWELNGLLTIKRKQNHYRVYEASDVNRIKVIKTLRSANFSLSAILRMLISLQKDQNTNIEYTINVPHPDEDIISVCDRLITSLENAKENCYEIQHILENMKKIKE